MADLQKERAERLEAYIRTRGHAHDCALRLDPIEYGTDCDCGLDQAIAPIITSTITPSPIPTTTVGPCRQRRCVLPNSHGGDHMNYNGQLFADARTPVPAKEPLCATCGAERSRHCYISGEMGSDRPHACADSLTHDHSFSPATEPNPIIREACARLARPSVPAAKEETIAEALDRANRHNGVASVPAAYQPLQEQVAWLIEIPATEGGRAEWWTVRIDDERDVRFAAFTFDANEAVRFARKEDADRVRRFLSYPGKYIVTEHLWWPVAHPAAADQPVQETCGIGGCKEPKGHAWKHRDARPFPPAAADQPVRGKRCPCGKVDLLDDAWVHGAHECADQPVREAERDRYFVHEPFVTNGNWQVRYGVPDSHWLVCNVPPFADDLPSAELRARQIAGALNAAASNPSAPQNAPTCRETFVEDGGDLDGNSATVCGNDLPCPNHPASSSPTEEDDPNACPCCGAPTGVMSSACFAMHEDGACKRCNSGNQQRAADHPSRSPITPTQQGEEPFPTERDVEELLRSPQRKPTITPTDQGER